MQIISFPLVSSFPFTTFKADSAMEARRKRKVQNVSIWRPERDVKHVNTLAQFRVRIDLLNRFIWLKSCKLENEYLK